MKIFFYTLIAILILNSNDCASQSTTYVIDQDTMIYDVTTRYLKNSKNKLKRFGSTCETLHSDETSETFYPSFINAFSLDSIQEYDSKNAGIIIYTVSNQDNKILELSFGISGVVMNSNFANALFNIEKAMIGKVLKHTHNCPDFEFFHTVFYIKFKDLNNYITSNNQDI